MAESLNRRKSIFLSHYECMRVAPLVRITLGVTSQDSDQSRKQGKQGKRESCDSISHRRSR
jgi:hypothetical protein